MKKRLFPKKVGSKIIIGEGYPYLKSFGGENFSSIEGVGLSLSSELVYKIQLPKLKKREAYRLVLEKLPHDWKSPLMEGK